MSEPSTPRLVFARERQFQAEAFEDIEPRPTSHIIKGVLPARGTGFMVGASKSGKTFVALDWSIKLAAGAQTVMQRKAKQVGVVYLGAEDPEGCRVRIKAFKTKNPRQSFTPFRFIPAKVNLLDPGEVSQFVVELGEIDAMFREHDTHLGLVVIDTFSRCLPGAEENSSEKMSLAVDGLDTIARELDCLVLALAHHGKDSSKGIRGWSGLDAASDATITVERLEEDPGQRTITLSKVKNGADGAVMGFTLDRQSTGLFDEDGDEITSCVVKYDYTDAVLPKSKRARRALSASAEIVLTSLNLLIQREICQAPPATAEGVRQGTWAVRRGDLSLEAATNGLRYDGDEPNTYNVRFGRAVTELIGAKKIRVMGDAIWAV